MNLLLDSHILLWTVEENNSLNTEVRKAITSEENNIVVSIVSLWELEIKRAAGKLRLPENFFNKLPSFRCEILGITLRHIEALGRLPPLHRDPFDRMLVAQAQCEQLILATRDDDITRYKVDILKA